MNVPPLDLLNAVDVLKKSADTEAALRAAANDEWQSGERHGPMLPCVAFCISGHFFLGCCC